MKCSNPDPLNPGMKCELESGHPLPHQCGRFKWSRMAEWPAIRHWEPTASSGLKDIREEI